MYGCFEMSTQLSILDALDICASRHGGSQESIDAHSRIIHSKEDKHQRIMKLVQARDGYGLTCKELAAAWGTHPNNVSGRLSELVQRGKLKKSGERRNGAAVLIET